MINNHYEFFRQLNEIKEKYFADILLSQLMIQFLGWLDSVKGIDNFLIIDDDTLIDYLQEFTEENI